MILPPDGNPPIVLEPGEQSFDLPASTVPSKWASILGFGAFPSRSVRSDQGNTVRGHLGVQRVTVISFIANDPFGVWNDEPPYEGLFDQLHFMRRSAVHVEGDRKTRSVCNCHDLGALPTFSLPNSGAPFLAGEKLPSMKDSRMSMPPRDRRSSAKARSISSKTPSFDHFWCQRWQVDLAGYRDGKSCHWAPVRRIQRIPLRTARGSVRTRPRGSGRSFGINGSITAHCSFVKSIQPYINTSPEMSSF